MATAQTATTQYVTASNGVHYAYRKLGTDNGVSLVMQIHFRANMDFWDPLLLNTISRTRPVIIFDQRGVGKTSGEAQSAFQGWADDLIAFVEALGLKQIDLLGFSMGGVAVQFVAVTAPQLIRKLILAGTSSPVPMAEHPPYIIWPREAIDYKYLEVLANSANQEDDKEGLAYSFFYNTPHGRSAFDAYWKRLSERTAEPLNLRLLDRDTGAKNQMSAADKEIVDRSESGLFERLGSLKMPILIANGDGDVLHPSSRSWELYSQIPNAQLIMYPKAGHGFLWQYAKLFGRHINLFLDGVEYDDLVSE